MVDVVDYSQYTWIDTPVCVEGLKLASPKDIAATKINAIEGRGSRKADFFTRVYRLCSAQGLSGLRAGSFMLGRFVAKPLPQELWRELPPSVVAFLLNEYVLYEKYLHVLEEVGEIKLARAHSRIETEGIDNMVISNFDLYNFVPLMYACFDWQQIAAELSRLDHQENTHLLVEKLSQPVNQLFDLTKPWVKERVDQLRG